MASKRNSGGSVLDGVLVATAAPPSDHFDTIWGRAFRSCDRVWSAGRSVVHPQLAHVMMAALVIVDSTFGLPLKCSYYPFQTKEEYNVLRLTANPTTLNFGR